MGRILEFFGFEKHFSLNLKTKKSEFIEFLEMKVKPNNLFFFDIFDSNKEFYGKVNESDFWLRKPSGFYSKFHFASASGIIDESTDGTQLKIKIIGWNWFVLLMLFVITLIVGLSVKDIIKTDQYGILIFFGPIFLFFYLIMIFQIRQGVKNFKNHLITELFKVQDKL